MKEQLIKKSWKEYQETINNICKAEQLLHISFNNIEKKRDTIRDKYDFEIGFSLKLKDARMWAELANETIKYEVLFKNLDTMRHNALQLFYMKISSVCDDNVIITWENERCTVNGLLLKPILSI